MNLDKPENKGNGRVPAPESDGGMNPDLSVIILTHNTRDLLDEAVRSILEQTREISFEVIVVDNASKDGTTELMSDKYPGVTYIYNDENLGFTKGNNQGVRVSRGRYVMLLNSDTEITDGALDKIVVFMDERPDCGVVGCKLLNMDGGIQYSCRRFPSYHTALFNRYSILTRIFPQNKYSQSYLMSTIGHSETREVDWVSGAALTARREAIEDVGLLDERFISYCEDVDWCYRMHEKGWKVYFYPEAEIYHYIGQSSKKRPFRFIIIRHQSMYKFYRKHYSRYIKSMDYLVLLGVAARCGWKLLTTGLNVILKKKAQV